MFRAMTRHILAGLRNAGHVACDSHATRDALVARAGIAAERTIVVLNGPHPSCSPEAEPAADIDAARLLGHARRRLDLSTSAARSHASGSTIAACIVAALRRPATCGWCGSAGRSPPPNRHKCASSG